MSDGPIVRARPSRRVNIPKPDGGTRPLGVAAIEDIQKAVGGTPVQLRVPARAWGAQRARCARGRVKAA